MEVCSLIVQLARFWQDGGSPETFGAWLQSGLQRQRSRKLDLGGAVRQGLLSVTTNRKWG